MSTVIYLHCGRFVKRLPQVNEIRSVYNLHPDSELTVLNNHSCLPCIPKESAYSSSSKITGCLGLGIEF